LLLIALLLATWLLFRTPRKPDSPTVPKTTSSKTVSPTPAPTPTPAVAPASKPISGSQKRPDISPISRPLPLKGKVVVVDAGHGGSDPGTCKLGIQEALITLAVALELQKELEKNGATVVMTRTDNKVDLELVDILNIVQNTHPDFFISVHVNSSPRGEAVSGIQTYYRMPESQMFAHTLHAVMLKTLGANDGHVHTADFYVINYREAPAVLVETGYITNTPERRKLVSAQYQHDLAVAITAGVVKYLDKKRQLYRLRHLLLPPMSKVTI
jgi:N-acetylmuramoyl-L-alanine amidase